MAGSTKDFERRLAIDSMRRAIAVIEGAMADKAARLPEGTHRVDLDVAIAGDIVVAAPGEPGPDREAADAAPADLLAAVLDAMPDARSRRAALRRGFTRLAKSTREALEAIREAAEALTLDEARRAGRVKIIESPGRAGAVTGKPAVTVSGDADSRRVSVEVSAS